ncbi:tripartite tricarboxylate transporter substrate binding protein [Bradyrhizobium sp. LHD-71]|uniref:Bug family tripartite tricarboxylate transporter substrate binding protein n=1 Tax=Bradyrhizobium sp. LHD-71 TaxID=3072141 RepID=UPI0028101697|nr:tripartite tricarboxylate transporter substrate binding protein [Bradyrhizobium sp. LHD-71]MDQ8727426.1 tripartite tricarboxylate transporter substrate binding protein [Bradyrhizobium sp. LHD-71]
MTLFSRRTLLSGAAALAAVRPAAAQLSQRPVRIIVPFTAGGSSDILARIIAELLRAVLNQTIVAENRPGGNGAIGMLAVAMAEPDGHSIVAGHVGTHAITPAVTPPNGYDAAKSFTTVAVHATSSNLLVVPAESEVGGFQALLELAKKKPGALNYGSPGTGSPSHIATLQLAAMTGIDVVHVPYRGNSAAVTDLLGGRLQFMFASPAEILEHVRAGKLKALAASGSTRSAATPDIAPIAELGIPGFNFRTWHVMSVRSDTPADVLAKIRVAMTQVMKSDAYRQRLAGLSLDPGIDDGVEADRFVQKEIAYWTTFVKDAGIRAE